MCERRWKPQCETFDFNTSYNHGKLADDSPPNFHAQHVQRVIAGPRSPPSLGRWKFLGLIAVLPLAACHDPLAASCPEGWRVDKSELAVRLADIVLRENAYAKLLGPVPYDSGKALVSRNPNCCWLSSSIKSSADVILPLPAGSSYTIIYKRLLYGNKPYYYKRFYFDRCTSIFEDSGTFVSEREFHSIVRYRNGKF